MITQISDTYLDSILNYQERYEDSLLDDPDAEADFDGNGDSDEQD